MAQGVLIIVMLLFAATVSAIFFKKIKFPYTIGLVLVGIGLSLVCDRSGLNVSNIKLTPDLILYILLPALIFEAAVNMDTRSLVKNLVPSLVLAAPGLVIATVITGVAVFYLTPLEIGGAMLFGALISATDPVAVIGLFKEMGAPKRLTMLVDSESLFNDATAIVMFSIVMEIIKTGKPITLGACMGGAKEFAIVFLAGLLIGAAIGFIMTFIISFAGNDPLVQVTLTSIVAYTAFIISDKLGFSGVMSVVGAGLVISYYGKAHMSVEVKEYLGQFWEFASFVANSFIFLLLGFTEDLLLLKPSQGSSSDWFMYIAWAILAVLVARAVVVFGICPILGKLRKADKIEWRYQLIMFWGGLRGAVPMALVLSLPHDFKHRNLLVVLTLGIVLFTLLVQGTTVKRIMGWLKLDIIDPFTSGATVVARLLAGQKGLERINALSVAEEFSPQSVESLREKYNQKVEERTLALKELRNSPNFDRMTVSRNLWTECLSIMRTSYNYLHGRGLLSASTYRNFLSVSEQHFDIVASTNYLPEYTRWEGLQFRLEKRFTSLLIKIIPSRKLTHIFLNRILTHDIEKSFTIHYGTAQVLKMIKGSQEMYTLYPDLLQDCSDYFEKLNKISTEHIDRLKKHHNKELDSAVCNLLQRMVYDAEITEMEYLVINGIIPDVVGDSLIEELQEKIKKIKWS